MLKDSRGVTLVELLVALTITCVIALATAQTISTAQTTIDASSSQTVAALQSVRFSGFLKYDFVGASDVVVFDDVPPTSSTSLCTTWTPGATATWTDATQPGFTRQLFTVFIPTVTSPPAPGTSTTFLPSRIQRVGYEVRRESEAQYALYRVVCDGVESAQRMLSMGPDLGADASGTTTLRCFAADGTGLSMPVGQSTMTSSTQRCHMFGFVVPYSGTATALTRLRTDPALQRLRSVVNP